LIADWAEYDRDMRDGKRTVTDAASTFGLGEYFATSGKTAYLKRFRY
jgi:hypothetical protein